MHKLYVIDLQSCLKWISKVDGIDCKGNCMTRGIGRIFMFDIFWNYIYAQITSKAMIWVCRSTRKLLVSIGRIICNYFVACSMSLVWVIFGMFEQFCPYKNAVLRMGWKPSMSQTLFGFTSIWQTSWTHAVFGTSKVGSFFVKSNMTSNVVVCNGFSPPLTSIVWPLVALCSKRCGTHPIQKY